MYFIRKSSVIGKIWYSLDIRNVQAEPESETEREEEDRAVFLDDDRAGQSVNDFLFTISGGSGKLRKNDSCLFCTASFRGIYE